MKEVSGETPCFTICQVVCLGVGKNCMYVVYIEKNDLWERRESFTNVGLN